MIMMTMIMLNCIHPGSDKLLNYQQLQGFTQTEIKITQSSSCTKKDKWVGFRCKREGLFQPALWPKVSRHGLVGGQVSINKSEQRGERRCV